MLPPNSLRKSEQGRIGPFISLFFAGLILAISLFVTLNRQYVLDTLHFWSYHPSADVTAIADTIKLTDPGQFTFYSVRPEVDDSQTFNTKCGRTEQSTAILGCYVDDRIYLYNVTDSRLNGIKEVTAAHEMLHAVYQRMPDTEKAQVNKLVEAEYDKLSTNPDFAVRMAFYARTEPGERDNELHSIIGTEVANVSPDLEAHYAKYFTDRSKIVALHDSYDAEFTKLDNEAKALSAQLDTLSKKIDSDSALYNDEVKTLNKDISNFNQRASSGQFSSQAAFNSERQSLQQRVTSVSSLRSAINAEIDKYETLRKQYNDTVTQSRTLYQSIDSTLSPTPNI